MNEPQIHSHITDCLPEDHPMAHSTVLCECCDDMLHALNNETMTSWIETGRGNYCLECFFEIAKTDIADGVLHEFWGIK